MSLTTLLQQILKISKHSLNYSTLNDRQQRESQTWSNMLKKHKILMIKNITKHPSEEILSTIYACIFINLKKNTSVTALVMRNTSPQAIWTYLTTSLCQLKISSLFFNRDIVLVYIFKIPITHIVDEA